MKFGNIIEFEQVARQLPMATYKEVVVNGKEQQRYKAVWNVDSDCLAMVASRNYQIVQHRDVLLNFAEAMRDLGLEIEGKVITWKNGNRMKAEIKFGKEIEVNGDKLRFGVVLENSYDKSKSVKGQGLLFRLVCSNGLYLGKVMPEVNMKRIHTGKKEHIIEDLKRFVKRMIESDVKVKQVVSEAMENTLEWEIAKKLLEAAFHSKRWRKYFLKRFEQLQEEQGVVTRWDLYNEVTAVATHGIEEKSLSEAVRQRMQKSAQKILLVEVSH